MIVIIKLNILQIKCKNKLKIPFIKKNKKIKKKFIKFK